jgi:hypothetical protein
VGHRGANSKQTNHQHQCSTRHCQQAGSGNSNNERAIAVVNVAGRAQAVPPSHRNNKRGRPCTHCTFTPNQRTCQRPSVLPEVAIDRHALVEAQYTSCEELFAGYFRRRSQFVFETHKDLSRHFWMLF